MGRFALYPHTLVMAAPTIRFVTETGLWEVTYAGMCRRHHQDWQAWTFYHMAVAMYAAFSSPT